jgi:hypothetical protein
MDNCSLKYEIKRHSKIIACYLFGMEQYNKTDIGYKPFLNDNALNKRLFLIE